MGIRKHINLSERPVGPVILNVTSGETDTQVASQETDSRLDLRIPRQGPTSPVVNVPADKIALHDATLQAFLDGVPPEIRQ